MLSPYLGSYVIRRSAEGLGGDAIQHIFFTHAKIRNLDVALAVQHHVIQLQIPARGKNATSSSHSRLKSHNNKAGPDT